MNPQDIIDRLKRSSCPFAIIVEGKDDVFIYRRLAERMDQTLFLLLPCEGVGNLLEVFDRQSEFSSIEAIFIADQDMWVTTGIPIKYGVTNFRATVGYSIENDVFLDAEAYFLHLLSANERYDFHRVFNSLKALFAFLYDYHEANAPISEKRLLSAVGKPLKDISWQHNAVKTTLDVCQHPDIAPHFRAASQEWQDRIAGFPLCLIRGKSLLDTYHLIILNRPKGGAHHRREALLEMGLAHSLTHPNSWCSQHRTWIENIIR